MFRNNENFDIADMTPMNQIGRYNEVLVYYTIFINVCKVG